MKLKSEHFSKQSKKHPSGFASILVVLSTGLGLMIMLMIIYEDTTKSQESQKNNLLANDFQQREDAVLRALVNVVPNRAIQCMQDDSINLTESTAVKDPTWGRIFLDSFAQANAEKSISDETLEKFGINKNASRSANVADTIAYTTKVVASNVKEPTIGYYVSDGTTRYFNTTSSEYPPALTFTAGKSLQNIFYPLITNAKVYKSNVDGWIDERSTDGQYGKLPIPIANFNYGNNGKFIAKHNWWTFYLNFSRTDKDDAIDLAYKSARNLRQTAKKQYIISIYEIPSQLAINATSYAEFGTFADGSEWGSNITVSGGIFAEKVKSSGSFSPDAIASRKGVELKEGSAMTSTERAEAVELGKAYSISSSSDSGKVAFIPINRGLEFYDRFAAHDGDTKTNDYDNSGNVQNQYEYDSLSPTSWDYYSIGANQCRMNLVVTKVASPTNQTPTEIKFTYLVAGSQKTRIYTKDLNIVDDIHIFEWTGDSTIPFKPSSANADSRPAIELSLEKLQILLTALGADSPSVNNSISVNVDYVHNANILKPYRDGLVNNATNPVYKNDLCLILKDSDNLAIDASGSPSYTNGFSLVTNLRLIFADNVNTTPFTPGDNDYPPMSIFSPEKVFGDTAYAAKISIEGQVTSISKNSNKSDTEKNTPVAVADFYSGLEGNINGTNSVDLKSITDPTKLPPINMMNWMVTVREKHN